MPTDTAALRKLLADVGPIAWDDFATFGPPDLAFKIKTVLWEGTRALPALLDELDLLREVAAAAGELREDRDWSVKDANTAKARLDAALARLREAGR